MDIKEALQVVIDECPDDYAKTYAHAALCLGGATDAVVVSAGPVVGVAHKITGRAMAGEEMRVQALYVLSNTGSWRGARAREVKEVLRKGAK